MAAEMIEWWDARRRFAEVGADDHGPTLRNRQPPSDGPAKQVCGRLRDGTKSSSTPSRSNQTPFGLAACASCFAMDSAAVTSDSARR